MAYQYGNWGLDPRLNQPMSTGLTMPRYDATPVMGGDGVGLQEPSWNRGAPQSRGGSVMDMASTGAGVVSPWLSLGLNAASRAISYLGDSYGRGVRKRGMKAMESLYDKPVLDVPALTGLRQRAIYSQATKLAPNIDRQYGLNQGRGVAALYEGQVGATAQAEADAYYQNALETARRNMEINQARMAYR